MDLVHPAIEKYCTDYSTLPSEDCRVIFDYTSAHFEDAQMLIGPLEAGFLGLLIHIVGAFRVLEIGCYTGYSALAMAEAVPEDGVVETIDQDTEKGRLAQSFWRQSRSGHKIRFIPGTAANVLSTLTGPYDVVFIDADKENYPVYLDTSLPLLSPKGIIVADNTLWYGTVIDPDTSDKDGQAIRSFNEYVKSRKDLSATILPIRDGLTIIKKR